MTTEQRDEWGVIEDLHVVADTQKALRLALEIAAIEHGKFVAYTATDEELALYWTREAPQKPVALPAPMDVAGVLPIVNAWLKGRAKYGPEPDTDGSTKKGFLVMSGDSAQNYDAICVIRPQHTIYGK